MQFLPILILAFLTFAASPAEASQEGMPSMPLIKPRKTSVIESKDLGQALLEQRGFGDDEPMVQMMNLMMVGGSDVEGMEMGGMDMKQTAAPTTGQLHASEEAAMKTAAPPGSADIVQVGKVYTFRLTPSRKSIQTGTNMFTLRVVNNRSKKSEVVDFVTVTVSMAEMDMGSSEPEVRKVAPGTFEFHTAFSMQGKWLVRINVPRDEVTFMLGARQK